MTLISQAPQAIKLELLELLFTPDEISQIEDRYAIVLGLLRNQETQRELAARLEISIAKITRGSHALKRISPELKAYFEGVLHE